ncbi:MAG TPA: multicopper oxidase domain-containing protein [Gemmatimonadaceae bacterium]|nr:multicopper oxidase domain-containing protein [Gemmatimonadaceae bacterium]
MNTRALLLVASFVAPVAVSISTPNPSRNPSPMHRAAAVTDEAVANDNRHPAGHLVDGVLTIQLEAREVLWYPEEKPGASIPLYAFGEAGEPARVPGPLIRVPAGTRVHATVRNTLTKPLRLRGLQDRSSGMLDSIVIAPGATEDFQFRVDVPGTYYYWGRTESNFRPPGPGNIRDGQLVGAFIVDPAGTRPWPGERVLVITLFNDTLSSLGVKAERAQRVLRRELIPPDNWFTVTVNGRSWPHTERLAYAVGDTVRWRVINAAGAPHPMHLHGFFYDVDARGDAQRDTIYTPGQRRKVVTETIRGGSTMAMTWVPTRPGNWLSYCHLVPHIDPALRLTQQVAHDASAPMNHAEQGMAGLVMGIRVAPAKGMTVAAAEAPRRRLRLFINQREHVYGDQPGLSYVLQDGPIPPAPDSIRIPGSTIILHQHEPTEITVINHTSQETTVHWHGLEVESLYDGVGDWSGAGNRLATPIARGDSFVVRLTPHRAGTFIYHTHLDEATQLVSGLYGALLVLPENAPPDTTEHLFLFAVGGPSDEARATVNGSEAARPIELRTGIAHRFRFINISPLDERLVRLSGGSELQEWRALAKDGADLPSTQATPRPASVVLQPGETFDVEILRQRPESLTMEITSPGSIASRWAAIRRGARGSAIPRVVTSIAVTVR